MMTPMKNKVKALWKMCFNDGEAFTDMYFRLRYTNEVNIALESGEEVISALQMLPYPMTFCGTVIPTAYVSGACTHPDYRSKGAMRELLSQAFARMLKKGTLLSTLIPAEPWLFDYYSRMGYAPVFDYSRKSFSMPDLIPSEGITVERITGYQEEVYRYLQKKMLARPCCLQHTEADFRVILADLELSGGFLFIARREENIAGLAVVYPEETSLLINELLSDSIEVAHTLLYLLKQDTGYKDMTLITPPAEDMETHRLGMARIINAKAVLQIYATAYPQEEMQIELTDKQLHSNNGYYYLSKGKCLYSEQRLPGTHLPLEIGELTRKVLSPLHPYMSLMLN